MATIKQITANRHNGKKGGPKTPAGKARSSKNAITHGLSSLAHVLNRNWHDETQIKWEEFQSRMLGLLDPQGAIAEILAGSIIAAAWRLRRCQQLEEAIGKETMIQLRHCDHREELFSLGQRIKSLQATLVTIQSDMDHLPIVLNGEMSELQLEDLDHLGIFLEKLTLFGAESQSGVSCEIPTDTRAAMIEEHCRLMKTDRTTLMERFQEYLLEQQIFSNNELQRSSRRYGYLIDQVNDVSESEFTIAVESHRLLQGGQMQAFRLNRSLLRMLKDYQKINQIVPPLQPLLDKNNSQTVVKT